MFSEALALHRSGYLDSAQAAYRKVLSRVPKFIPALYHLGILLNQIGDHGGAIAQLEIACAIAQREPAIHLELAKARMATGDLDGARASCRRATALDPKDLDALRLQVEIDERLEDIPAAIESYKAILARCGDAPEIHNNLGILYRRSGDAHAAVVCYEKALALRPQYTIAWNNHGNALKELGQTDVAIASYEKAAALDARYTDALFNLALTYQQTQRLDRAIELFERVLALDTENENTHLQLAETLLSAGRFEAAREHLDAILSKNESCAEAYYLQSQQRRYTEDDLAVVRKVERISAAPGLIDQQRIYLDFALGKMFDDLGRYDEAFAYFKRGNHRRSAQADWQQDPDDLVAAITATHPPRSVATPSMEQSGPLRTPIFVVGMPRSGTTLVEQCLAGHPAVFGAGELDFFGATAQALQTRLDSERPYPHNLNDLSVDHRGSIAREYLESVKSRIGAATCFVDKMPENYLHLGFIRLIFPGAPVIHCRRNPLDTCLSAYFQLFSSGHGYAYDLDSIAARYLDYCRVMEHWRTIYGASIHAIDYESLVADRARITRDLVEYCGLPWDENCLSQDSRHRPVTTASRWQVRQPIYRHAINRWEHYADHIGVLIEKLAPVL